MTFKLRPYQERCVDLTLAALENNEEAAPIADTTPDFEPLYRRPD